MARRVKTKNIDIKTGVIFSLLGFLGTLLGARLVPLFPDRVLIILFALLMFAAAIGMWRNRVHDREITAAAWPLVILTASGIGVLTGLFGIGGGFLIVPALVLILGIRVKLAAGTSLVAITLNSVIAFLLRHQYWHLVPWSSILVFTGAAVVASFVTAPLAAKLPAQDLARAISILVALVATYMVITQGLK